MEPIRYARCGDVRIAYQRYGSGPIDVLAIPPFAQNIELAWERPEFSTMYERIGRYARVVHFDKRGTGMSDRGSAVPTLDERVEDARAVMDAAGLQRAAVHGVSEGGSAAILFARTYPERVTSLVLQATSANLADPDANPDEIAARDAAYVERWGTDRSLTLRILAPSVATDPSYAAWNQRYERHSATPGAIGDLLHMLHHIDVRPLLAEIDVPTLILHATGDPSIPVEHARQMAAAIPNARLVEWDGVDHFVHIGNTDVWHRALEEFLTGLPAQPHQPTSPHRREIKIRTFGGFAVNVDGIDIAPAVWGSRRARQLCKRLAAAAGAAVTRDELFEQLWPGDLAARSVLGARLSVQLAAVRRVLGGGVIADRSTVRLDTASLQLDLVAFNAAIAAGRNAAAANLYKGPFLPEDSDDQWATDVRSRTTIQQRGALNRLFDTATSANRHDEALSYALQARDLDPYDEPSHHAVIATLLTLGRSRDAEQAHATYKTNMNELDITPVPLNDLARRLD